MERPEFLQLIKLVSTRKYDLIVAEDLSRIARRMQAHLFCETCVECKTRVITLNEGFDTGRKGWQDCSIINAWHGERSNRDTSDRIKRSHHNLFMNGGCFGCEIFGYVKPENAKNEMAVYKNPVAEPIYAEWFRMLEKGALFSEIADWLNRKNVPVGPHARKDRWDGKMVASTTRKPILKGVRERNRYKSVRKALGKYRSEKAEPHELLQRVVPHLAFFDAEYFDRVVAMVNERNVRYRRSDDPRRDPLRDCPKKRTRFPGQCIFCGICGRLFVFGGHGQTDHLMCNGARDYTCWNGATIDGPLANRFISRAIFAAIDKLPPFDEKLIENVREEARRLDTERESAAAELRKQLASTEEEISHILAYIHRVGEAAEATLANDLQQHQAEAAGLKGRLNAIVNTTYQTVEIPSIEEIKGMATKMFDGLSEDSFDYGRIMRQLVPRIVVFPHRHIGCNKVVLRAKFRLNLDMLLPTERQQELFSSSLQQIVAVDLFEPIQPEKHRLEILRARAAGLTEKAAAAQCGITITAAQRAAEFQRRMDSLGLTDPYVAVTEPPIGGSRIKRHLHPRYHFEPLPDACKL